MLQMLEESLILVGADVDIDVRVFITTFQMMRKMILILMTLFLWRLLKCLRWSLFV